MGLLPKGQLVECEKSSLVAGYLGQTAIKTQAVIEKALGGVLFIDEAYSLTDDERDFFGREAVETILKAMEDHRDELIVIVAGYTELMHEFIDSNPGLQSRFNKYFEFPDYTGEELLAIFQRFCSKNGYKLDASAENQLLGTFDLLYEERDDHFGNARAARNIFEKAIHAQADRLAALEGELSDSELELINAEDIKLALKDI
jgi:SpoVK/Ycf46/Vps4 family AAA+-type ATPase